MKKERLTDENIIEDIRYTEKYYSSGVKSKLENSIVMLSIAAAFVTCVLTWSWWGLLFLLAPFAWVAATYFLQKKKLDAITPDDFVVDTDRMNVVEEKVISVGGKYSKSKTIRVMYFEGGAEWEIPYDNYTWSTDYKMSRNGIDNTSFTNDEFYIVRMKKNGNVAVAYNRKFFVYDRDGENAPDTVEKRFVP